jgi:hypothetical protein
MQRPQRKMACCFTNGETGETNETKFLTFSYRSGIYGMRLKQAETVLGKIAI